MQHDHASGIAVLLDGPNRDAFALCTFPQAGQKFEAFASGAMRTDSWRAPREGCRAWPCSHEQC